MVTPPIPSAVATLTRTSPPDLLLEGLHRENLANFEQASPGSRRPSLPVLHCLQSEDRDVLLEALGSVRRQLSTAANVLVAGPGKNTAELLLVGHAFPGAAVSAIEPNHGDFLSARLGQIRSESEWAAEIIGRTTLHRTTLEQMRGVPAADVGYVSGLFSDDYVFPKIKQGQQALTALCAGLQDGALLVTDGFYQPYLPLVAALGLGLQESHRRFSIYRKDESLVHPVRFPSLDTAGPIEERLTGFGYDANSRSYDFGRIRILITERPIQNLEVRGLGRFPIATTEVLVENDHSAVYVQGPVGTPLWRLVINRTGEFDLNLTAKFFSLLRRHEQGEHMSGADKALLGSIGFDCKWGFFNRLKEAFSTSGTPEGAFEACRLTCPALHQTRLV